MKTALAILAFLPFILSIPQFPMNIKEPPKFYQQYLTIPNSCAPVTLVNQSAMTASPYVMYSGYLNVNPGQSNSSLYYTFVGKQGVTNTSQLGSIPLVIWMNGGPGSTSQTGLFYENGPLNLKKNGKGIVEEYRSNISWNQNYNVLYLDQPIGTGASYAQTQSELCTNEVQVSQQWYTAIQQLNTLSNCSFFSAYFKSSSNPSPVFVVGESYAGKYIPNIGAYVVKQNLGGLSASKQLNLKGIGYGNGFTDPVTIASEYGAYAYNLGLIDYNQRQQIEYALLQLKYAQETQQWVEATNIFNTLFTNMQMMAGNPYTYDMFQYQAPVDFDLMDEFFQTPSTAAKYNIPAGITFDSNGGLVYTTLGKDFMQDALKEITYCITSGIKVLIYEGQDDLIVPNPGTMKWVDSLTWPGSDSFNNKDLTFWKNSEGKPAGYYKRYQQNNTHLEFRLINKAGHFAPFYQPQNCLEMLDYFINSL